MLKAHLDRFATTRGRTLDLVENLSQAQADHTPAPGRWSVGEVLDHLLLAERFFRGEIRQLIDLARSGREPVLRRSFADLDISIAFIPKGLLPYLSWPFTVVSWILPDCVRDFFLRSRLVPAQHPAVSAPRKGRPLALLREELAASLRETLALFEASRNLAYDRMWHSHPLLGTNDVRGLLHIVTLHEERHQGQVTDLLHSVPLAA